MPDNILLYIAWGIGILVVLILFFTMIRQINQYEKAIVLRFGKFIKILNPGLHIVIPMVDSVTKIDIRTRTIDVKPQEVITKDNVTIKVDGVVYFNIFNAELALLAVENYYNASTLMAQTTLRDIMGQYMLDEILRDRQTIADRIQSIVDKETDPWGVKVTNVEIKQIVLPENMQRVMAAEAEAERERRAKIIHAEGEVQSSQKLLDAATVLAHDPIALQLRFMQTLTEIASEKNMIVVVPMPEKIIATIQNIGNGIEKLHEINKTQQ